ncbi:MAG: glutamyl-tRNA reductase [Chthoniobacterales bacterium]|nr:glutamyl-tRNA reductase [Chthoniobacterales bacterium]
MNIFCAGLNHRTASLSMREQAAIQDREMAAMLERVRKIDGVSGAVMLSTCNRVELYASTLCPLQTLHGFEEILQERSGEMLPLYHHTTPAAVRHLFRVASGLDSMVIGETEIFGQVKKAYALASEYGTTTGPLHRLFQHAFRVAKSVRTETQITRGAVSVGSVAVELAEKIFGELDQCRVMILGAGEISERTARSLQSRGVRSVIVSNRTYDRAAALAAEIGGMALHFDHWEKTFADVDIVISSTGAPHAILTVEKLKPLLKQRKKRPLFVIDLAVPRDAEPAINELEGVFLYDIDSLQQIAAQSLDVRRQEVVRCELMIEEHVGTFLKWLRSKNSSGAKMRES